MRKLLNSLQHFFEAILVLIMTVGGVQTIWYSGAAVATTTALGAALSNPWFIVAFGFVFTVAGTVLGLSKLFHNHKAHQWALMTIFVFNLFGAIFEVLITGVSAYGWADNLFYAIVAGLIHLRREHKAPPKVRSKRWLHRRINKVLE